MTKAAGRGGFALTQYLTDVRAEMRKVVWPTREDASNLTAVVLFVVVLMTLILGGMDFLFGRLLEFLLSLGG